MVKVICNIIGYLNVWFVCLRSYEDYKVVVFPTAGGEIREDIYSGHKSFCIL